MERANQVQDVAWCDHLRDESYRGTNNALNLPLASSTLVTLFSRSLLKRLGRRLLGSSSASAGSLEKTLQSVYGHLPTNEIATKKSTRHQEVDSSLRSRLVIEKSTRP